MMEWVSGGSAVIELLLEERRSQTYGVRRRRSARIWQFSNVAMSANGKTMVAQEVHSRPRPRFGPVHRANFSDLRRINADLKPAWGAGGSIEWVNDGTRVQGWLVSPLNMQPGRRTQWLSYPTADRRA